MTTEAQAMRAAAAKIARENENRPLGRTGGYAGGWREACAYIQERIEVLPLPPPQPNPTVEAMAAALEVFAQATNGNGFHSSHLEAARAALADFRKEEAK